MKKFKLVAAFAMAIVFGSCTGNAQDNNQTTSKTTNKIEVLDFHSTHRCMTCNAIESSTKYTLEKYFAEEVKAGTITFKTVNIDEEENYALAEKFEAAGTSLFLNVIIDGVETKIDLTDFAFTFGNDQAEFSKRFKTKVNKQLKNL
tara:strand:+ start:72167 stop:72604 length:438 start_codon:yes stop_codon:yes gene_type:complete